MHVRICASATIEKIKKTQAVYAMNFLNFLIVGLQKISQMEGYLHATDDVQCSEKSISNTRTYSLLEEVLTMGIPRIESKQAEDLRF